MKIKPTYIIVVVLIVLSVALAYDAFTSYISPYLTVSQVVGNQAAYVNKEVQILGLVENGTVGWVGSNLSFNLTDEKSVIKVSYEGSAPQGFNEGQQVVVIGKLVSTGSVNASQMLVKCPSKYEGDQRSLLSDPIFLAAAVLGGIALVYFVVITVFKKS